MMSLDHYRILIGYDTSHVRFFVDPCLIRVLDIYFRYGLIALILEAIIP